MSVAATSPAAAALATDGLDALEHILNAPPELPRLAWEPAHKEFIIQLYTALRERIDSEIREGIAHGRRQVLDAPVNPNVIVEATMFFGDVTERLKKDYAKNYYYIARRFYPADSMDDPDADDSDYEEQLATHNYYMSLPAPSPHLIETYPQFADIGEDIKRVAYELFDAYLNDLHVVALDYAVLLTEKIEAAAAGHV
jgi:hypothetical protein